MRKPNNVPLAGCLALLFMAAPLLAQNFSITSFQPNGALTWTNLPGTNAFAVQWTPSLSGTIVWSYAPAPLDLTITTGSSTTVNVPTNKWNAFFRVVEGFSDDSFHGTWIIPASGGTNVGSLYLMSDGNGTVTNLAVFNMATPPGTYTASSTGAASITLDFASGSTMTLTGQLTPPRTFVFTGGGAAASFSPGMPVQNLGLCAGTWTGTLTETNDPSGLSNYGITLTVRTNGSATMTGSFSETGHIFSLAATNGAVSSFFQTGTTSPPHYDQIRINGTLNGNTITGSYTTDSGSGASAVNGTVSLTR